MLGYGREQGDHFRRSFVSLGTAPTRSKPPGPTFVAQSDHLPRGEHGGSVSSTYESPGPRPPPSGGRGPVSYDPTIPNPPGISYGGSVFPNFVAGYLVLAGRWDDRTTGPAAPAVQRGSVCYSEPGTEEEHGHGNGAQRLVFDDGPSGSARERNRGLPAHHRRGVLRRIGHRPRRDRIRPREAPDRRHHRRDLHRARGRDRREAARHRGRQPRQGLRPHLPDAPRRQDRDVIQAPHPQP